MIETVGDLKELLSQYPDNFPVKIQIAPWKVDDIEDNIFMLEDSLDIIGYELSTVHDGVNDVILTVE